jgi:hypothetical protein
MGWFERKPSWEVQYAQNIYDALVVRNSIRDITTELRIPTAHAYQNKIVLQRELISFVALMETAKPGSKLQSVMLEYENLLVHKIAERGLQMNRDQLANAAKDDVGTMIAEPFKWAQRWLSEFRDDPKDNYMVAVFAAHCLRVHEAYKRAIEQTQPH